MNTHQEKEKAMRLLAILTVAGCALTAAAQDLKLQGETVPPGTNTASVVNERQQREEIVAAMQAIRIPEIDFRQADLRDVILFLANASREMTTNQFQAGFIVKYYDQTLFDSSNTNSEPRAATDAPKITFSAIDITLNYSHISTDLPKSPTSWLPTANACWSAAASRLETASN